MRPGEALADRVAIVGVGTSAVDRDPATDLIPLVVAAFKQALGDAGLERAAIDGMVLAPTVPDDIGFDRFPMLLGLDNIRWTMQTWQHDRLLPCLLLGAVSAVRAGLATTVVCAGLGEPVAAFRRWVHANPVRFEDRQPGYYGTHLQAAAYGGTTPHAGAALSLRRYLDKYGYGPADLAAVALAQRAWANLNPDAYFHDRPLTLDQYLASPYVVEPLRMYDCGLPANVAYCFIITSTERARDLRREPILIGGLQGPRYNSDTFILGRPGLGVVFQDEFTYRPPAWPIYQMAELGPADVDLVYALDSFAPLVPFGLELFGFCADGEGLAFLRDGRAAPGGALPINTSGGGLSEADSRGYGHLVEAVRQLRGECGPRQVPGARVAQYLNPDGGSVLLRRG